MVETGLLLRNMRESSGISLEEVEKDIEIPVIYLQQLEAGKIGSFEDIYKLKEMLITYSKYLGLDTGEVTNKFNEYMFEYTSKIKLDEIQKAIREHQKEIDEEDRVYSPYTRVYPKEKKLSYILSVLVIIILVILAVIWSVKQITIENISTDEISFVE